MEARIGVFGQANPVAVFDYAPIFEDENVVGALDGAQAVRHDDSGALVGQLIHGTLDQRLGGLPGLRARP